MRPRPRHAAAPLRRTSLLVHVAESPELLHECWVRRCGFVAQLQCGGSALKLRTKQVGQLFKHFGMFVGHIASLIRIRSAVM